MKRYKATLVVRSEMLCVGDRPNKTVTYPGGVFRAASPAGAIRQAAELSWDFKNLVAIRVKVIK